MLGSISWLTLAIVAGAIAGSTLIVLLAWRGRRIDDHPLCRRCRFDLSGIERRAESRCPECGGGLDGPRAVRIGNRRRRGWQVVASAMLLLVVLGAGTMTIWSSATSFDWNTIKPNWMLVRESRGLGAGSHAALDEIRRRIATKDIDESSVLSLVDLMLERQASGLWLEVWGDVVEEAREAGLVSDEQWSTYAMQAILITTDHRRRVHEGLTLPLKMEIFMRCGGRGPRTNALIHAGPAAGAGLDPDAPMSLWRTGLPNNSRTTTWTHHLSLDGAEIGDVDITVPVHVEVFDLASRGGASLGVIERDLELSIEVVDPSDAVVHLIEPDEATRRQLDSLRVTLRRSPSTGLVDIKLDTIGVTVPIAAHVILRQGGIDMDIGSIAVSEASGGLVALLSASPEPGVYDVILRPDPDAAHAVVGMDRIWGEEIVVRNVLLR